MNEKSPAELFADHLERNYGLQLTASRRAILVAELEAFAKPPEPTEPPVETPTEGESHAD